MPLTFDTFLFDAFSQLSGGFITDMKTLLLGCLFLGVVLMGGDILFEKLQISMMNFAAGKSFSAAQGFLGLRDSSGAGSAEYQYYDSLYKAHLNRSVGISLKTGKTFSVDNSFDHGGAGFNPLYADEGGGSSDESHGIDPPEGYVYHGNDVFVGARFGSDDDHEVDFDGELDSPGLRQRYVRNKYNIR